ISPSTQISLYSRSMCVRTATTRSRTVHTRRSAGLKLNPSWSVELMAGSVKQHSAISTLLSQASDKIQHHRKHHAQQNRRSQREIERRVLPAIHDVPWKSPERNIHPPKQHQHQPGDHQDQSKEQQ